METTKIANRKKIYEEIAEQIKEQIMSGALKPGQRLPTSKELAERYQVGRSTVREALSALKVMGLIETRQGEGSTVSNMKPEDVEMPDLQHVLMSDETILELMEARKSLESSIVALAAKKRTIDDLKKIQEILNFMELNSSDKDESEKADMLFHLYLAQSTHNSIIVRLLETIWEPMSKAMKEIRRMYLDGPALNKKILEEHRRIYQAILDQDSDLAEKRLLEHLDHFELHLKKMLKSDTENEY